MVTNIISFILPKALEEYEKVKQSKTIQLVQFLSWLSGLRTRLASMKMWVPSLVSLSGLSVQHCPKLQCR